MQQELCLSNPRKATEIVEEYLDSQLFADPRVKHCGHPADTLQTVRGLLRQTFAKTAGRPATSTAGCPRTVS